jgi:hypothetical protein
MDKKIMQYYRVGYAHVTVYDDGSGTVSFDPIYPARGVIICDPPDDGVEWRLVDAAELTNP